MALLSIMFSIETHAGTIFHGKSNCFFNIQEPKKITTQGKKLCAHIFLVELLLQREYFQYTLEPNVGL